MKVLHVNNVANVPEGLVRGLNSIGVEAHLFQPFTGINKTGRFAKLSVLAHRIRDTRLVAKQVLKENYDIVHIHYAYFGILGILGGYQYWLHCHGTDIRRNLNNPAYGKITSLSLMRAKRVLYSTPDLKKYADKIRPDAVFLPNPIQTDKFKPRSLKGTDGKILLISRIDKVKGIDTAFKAFEILKKQNPTVQIDVFSWGPDLARFKNKQFVNFIPTVKHEELGELISNYQIIVGQFDLGIMGMSEMEAMACARPVVSYFKYQDWYAEAPPLISTKNEVEIAAQIEGLLAKPKLCEEIGQAGRGWVIKYHDYIAVAKKLAELYKR
ncbi:MAG: glycosyltransferase family 4 protein [Firmicutes bacterium]|nr:glycosyltransferase family 4 protein [Bacillota bacterium]